MAFTSHVEQKEFLICQDCKLWGGIACLEIIFLASFGPLRMDAQQSDFERESAMSQLAVGLRGRRNQFNHTVNAKLSRRL